MLAVPKYAGGVQALTGLSYSCTCRFSGANRSVPVTCASSDRLCVVTSQQAATSDGPRAQASLCSNDTRRLTDLKSRAALRRCKGNTREEILWTRRSYQSPCMWLPFASLPQGLRVAQTQSRRATHGM